MSKKYGKKDDKVEVIKCHEKEEEKNSPFNCEDDNMCKKQHENIINDLKKSFKNLDDVVTKTIKHSDDKSGKSLVKLWQLNIKNGHIVVRYTNWSDAMKYTDNVDVEILTHEVYKWVKNNFGVGYN